MNTRFDDVNRGSGEDSMADGKETCSSWNGSHSNKRNIYENARLYENTDRGY